MYSQEEINTALKMYHQCNSVTETVRVLGYPSRKALYTWIHNEDTPKQNRKKWLLVNTFEHPGNSSVQTKLEAIHRCFEQGESVKSVSEDIGYSRVSIYAWRKKYLQKSMTALMNEKNISPQSLKEGSTFTNSEVEELRAQMFDMQLEIDILKETINILKKDPGIDQTALKNREKAVIVDALKKISIHCRFCWKNQICPEAAATIMSLLPNDRINMRHYGKHIIKIFYEDSVKILSQNKFSRLVAGS